MRSSMVMVLALLAFAPTSELAVEFLKLPNLK